MTLIISIKNTESLIKSKQNTELC